MAYTKVRQERALRSQAILDFLRSLK